MRPGLDRASALRVGGLVAELVAGARLQAGRGPEAFARGELAWHPAEPLSLFGFVDAAVGPSVPMSVQAGVGARLVF